jgi:hypothetical protein
MKSVSLEHDFDLCRAEQIRREIGRCVTVPDANPTADIVPSYLIELTILNLTYFAVI